MSIRRGHFHILSVGSTVAAVSRTQRTYGQARLGVLVAIPLYGWDAQAQDVQRHNELTRQMGHEPVPPITSSFVYCAATEKEAREGARKWMGGYGARRRSYHFSDGHSRPSRATSTTVSLLTTPNYYPEQGVEGFISLQVAARRRNA